MQIGWHENMLNSEYHASIGLSSTQVKDLIKSGRRFKEKHLDGGKRKKDDLNPNFMFGSLFHMRLLEGPKVLDQNIWNYGQKPNLRSNLGKLKWENITKEYLLRREENPDLLMCSDEELLQIETMASRVLDKEEVAKFLMGKNSLKEKSGYWEDPETGVLCKLRTDLYVPEEGVILDVKTAYSAERADFEGAISKYGYDISASFYCEGVRAIDGILPKFIIVAVGKRGNHTVNTFEIPEERLIRGKRLIEQALIRYKHGMETGEWPDFELEE